MDRSRLEPLGVRDDGFGYADAEARSQPNALDKWMLRTIITKLGDSPVRVALWDEPDMAPREGTVRLRILDRKAAKPNVCPRP